MPYTQVKRPNTTVPAPPGWCLKYVQDAFGTRWAGPTASAAWTLAKHRHANSKFPASVFVPVFFHMQNVPEGHVAIRTPSGHYWSASDHDNAPDYHPTLKHLLDFYGGRLTLRGWSEDLNGDRVVKPKVITAIKKVVKRPAKKVYHTVRPGDTLYHLAIDYKTTIAKIAKLNPNLKDVNKINIGQKLRIK